MGFDCLEPGRAHFFLGALSFDRWLDTSRTQLEKRKHRHLPAHRIPRAADCTLACLPYNAQRSAAQFSEANTARMDILRIDTRLRQARY